MATLNALACHALAILHARGRESLLRTAQINQTDNQQKEHSNSLCGFGKYHVLHKAFPFLLAFLAFGLTRNASSPKWDGHYERFRPWVHADHADLQKPEFDCMVL
ncbi:MAG TPA: hypothetical protein VI636_03555 [Candidatus Angelobacter sp.]